VTIHVLSNKAMAAGAAILLLLGCAGRARSPAVASAAPANSATGTAVPERGPAVTPRPVDLYGDGHPEQWRLEAADGALTGTEHDGNGDGRVDRWVRLGPDGAPAQVAVDLDFDGRADVTRWYERGRLVRSEEAIPGLDRRERRPDVE
jgi:hypothetical protein